jgi:hypothetical protein
VSQAVCIATLRVARIALGGPLSSSSRGDETACLLPRPPISGARSGVYGDAPRRAILAIEQPALEVGATGRR